MLDSTKPGKAIQKKENELDGFCLIPQTQSFLREYSLIIKTRRYAPYEAHISVRLYIGFLFFHLLSEE